MIDLYNGVYSLSPRCCPGQCAKLNGTFLSQKRAAIKTMLLKDKKFFFFPIINTTHTRLTTDVFLKQLKRQGDHFIVIY